MLREDNPSEFCSMCQMTLVYTHGAICQACVSKAEKLVQCRKNHSIVTRIIKGRSACVIKGHEVVHIGRGCEGCLFDG